MITGTTVLGGFDTVQEEASRAFETASAELQRLSDRLMRLRAAEGEAYRELAELRLTAAASDRSALDGLAEAGSRVRALLEANASAIAEASEAVRRSEEAVQAARVARDQAEAAADAAEVEQARGIEAVRARLAADPAWQGLRDTAERAVRTARRAEEKTRSAEADRATKGTPYEADPLFAYLWQRGFGTPAYRSRGIVRSLDSWVAKVAAYEPARRNFAALDALPGRLAQHTTRLQEEADAAAKALAAFEIASAERAGAPSAAETARLRAAAEAAEDALEAAEAQRNAARERVTAIAAGDDEGAKAALRQLEAALTRTDLKALRQAAARTLDERDDVIVQKLIDIEAERVRAERDIAERRAAVEDARARLGQVEQLRTEYRRRGWQGDAWDFKDGAMVGLLIGEVLKGAMGQDGFWERMGRHRRGRDPWGGAGGGGAPWGGSPWGGGGGGGSGGGSGGFGGGGFRTGGGFGGGSGGGFRTGGGF